VIVQIDSVFDVFGVRQYTDSCVTVVDLHSADKVKYERLHLVKVSRRADTVRSVQYKDDVGGTIDYLSCNRTASSLSSLQ